MAVLVPLMAGSVAFANQRMLTTQHTTSADIARDVESMFKRWWMQTFDSFALVLSVQAEPMMQGHSINVLN